MAGKHLRRRTDHRVRFTGRLIVSAVAALVALVLSGGTIGLTELTAGAEKLSVAGLAPDRAWPPKGSVVASAGSGGGSRVALPARSGTGRRIVYCNSCQRVWLVEAATSVSRTYRVSGRQGVPRPGMYKVNSKSELAFSEHGWRLAHMVRFANGRRLPIGFHAIPVGSRGPVQPLSHLGRPLSSGCVRQAPADAQALWEFAALGTQVVVVA